MTQSQNPANPAQTIRPPPNLSPPGNMADEDKPIISRKVMQEMISSYVQLNDKLMDKICALQEELDAKNANEHQSSFQEEYSVMNTDFSEIEEQIKEYRSSLTAYQQQVQADIRDKDKAIDQLGQEVAGLKRQLQNQASYIQELEIKNAALEDTKDSLLLELEEMEIDLRRSQVATTSKMSKFGKRSSDIYENYSFQSRDFSENVQAELEKLINKLMKELQYEQANKKNLAAQIKRLQLDIIELEKEIIEKNNRIYSLQLKVIKSSKSNPNLTISNIVSQRKQSPYINGISFDSSFQNNDTEKTKRKDSKSLNLTITQLMAENVSLKYEQKVYLCIRILEVFIDKLQKKNFSLQQPSTIEIHNFSSRQPHLYSIKLAKKSGFERQKCFTPQALPQITSNLFDILDKVLQNSKGHKKNAQTDIRQKGVCLLLSNARKNKNCQAQELVSLKETLEQLVEQGDEEKYQ